MTSSGTSAQSSARAAPSIWPLVLGLFAVQGALWIVTSVLFDGSIRLDVAEGVIDGPAWQLSYLRHPPLSTWLTGLAWRAGPLRYAAVDAIGVALTYGALAILAAFLSRVDRREAGFIAIVAALVSPFATYGPLQVNHNIGLLPFWAATLAAAWFAFEGGTLGAWVLFGVAVGLGLWAKYAILHLVIPLAVLFVLTPAWRARLATPGPWLAALIAALIIAPHAVDAAQKGGATVQFALRTFESGPLVRLGWMAEFFVDCLALQPLMAAIALVACGRERLTRQLRAMTRPATMTRLDLYLLSAAAGPPLVVIVAAMFGVRPHYLWATAFNISFAAWWGHAAGRAGAEAPSRRLLILYASCATAAICAYIGVREIAPRVLKQVTYTEMDGPALAKLAETYWRQHESGAILYIMSFNVQHGRQAAGSIVFDLPYQPKVIEDDDMRTAPWVEPADVKRRGALIVSPRIPPPTTALGVTLQDVSSFERPMMRGAKSEPIYFAILPPAR